MFKYQLFLIFLIIIIGCSDSSDELERKPDIWYDITPNESDLYNSIYFINATEGWIAGSTRCLEGDPRPPCPGWGGVVYHTDDGGASWERALVTTDASLTAIHFFDDMNGIVMRSNVHETTDGGTAWTEVTKLVGSIVRDMEVDDKSIGWAVASSSELGGAVVLKSEEGLRTWHVLDSSLRKGDDGGVYLSISAPTSTTIYATGFGTPSKALLVKTTNAGATWEDIPLPGATDGEGDRYYCVDFIDDSTGWLGGQYGEIYYTSNGGNTWSNKEIGFGSAAIYDLDAIDINHVVAVTSEGAVFITRDGGNIWDEQQGEDSDHPLTHVFYHESDNVYIAGNGKVFTARLSY